jgi:dTDP-3-amino-3,4,6-trideoxy-alpha-D-glucose transaminase
MNIPYFDMKRENEPLAQELNTAVLEILSSGHFILGPKLEQFEAQFAKYCQTQFCLGVGNGLEALTLSLKAAGIGLGDKVAIPAHTFIATALGVIATGAEPVLVDVDRETFTILPSHLEQLNDKSIKAVIPVHLYGHPCEMDSINQIAKEKSWLVLEDNAQAHGALYKGRKTGGLGHISATSFYPTKNLGAFGDGGAVTTNSEAFAQQLGWLRNYGQSEKYNHVADGGNSRLDDIQAAILSVKLKYLDESNQKRNLGARRYLRQLQGVGDLQLPTIRENSTHVFHVFAVLTSKRDECLKYLKDRGVGCIVHYPKAIHQHKAFSESGWNSPNGSFLNSEFVCKNILSLPLSPQLPLDQIDRVCELLRDFFKK